MTAIDRLEVILSKLNSIRDELDTAKSLCSVKPVDDLRKQILHLQEKIDDREIDSLSAICVQLEAIAESANLIGADLEMAASSIVDAVDDVDETEELIYITMDEV
jgi:hypothetical protein